MVDCHSLTVDELMHRQACDGDLICMTCGKQLGYQLAHMKRHLRDIHLSSDKDYYCPPCDKHFKNRGCIYFHIRTNHKDWKGVDYDSFAVKS